jgi:hypothetical protein
MKSIRVPGTSHTMQATIDFSGRVIRWRARLEPGMTLDIRYVDGRIELEPASVNVNLAREGRFVVAVPEEATEALTTDVVEHARHALHDSLSEQS